MTINSVDVSLLCLNIIGVVLSIGYLVFAYLVTHRGDFYHVRRWKFALWVANTTGLVLLAVFILPSITLISGNSAQDETGGLFGIVASAIFSTLTYLIPFLFVVAIGTYYQFKWWLNSDDFLDKLWKDPNKGHTSPIQDL